jgi:peptidoglycan-associated lipoprotein
MLRRAVLFSLLVVTPALACSRRQPPEEPTPVLPDTAGEGQRALDQARQDSIRRAQEDERMRMEGAAAEAARVRGMLEEMIFFDYDDSDLRVDAQETLARKVAVLRANPDVTLRITGHADERGSIEYNLALGLRRANAVKDYLTGFGLSGARFTTETMGEDRPLDPGSGESAWARNRRAEFTVTAGGEQLVAPGN